MVPRTASFSRGRSMNSKPVLKVSSWEKKRVGSPEGLGQSPTEPPAYFPHSQLRSSPIPGQGLCWCSTGLGCRDPPHHHIHHQQLAAHLGLAFQVCPACHTPAYPLPPTPPRAGGPQTLRSYPGCLSIPSHLWPPLTPLPPCDSGSTIMALTNIPQA